MCKVWLSNKNKQITIIKGVNGSWYSALAKKQFAKINVFGVTYKWKVKHVDYIHCIETHTVLLSSHSLFSSAFSWN